MKRQLTQAELATAVWKEFIDAVPELFRGDAEWLNEMCGITSRKRSESREPCPKLQNETRGCLGLS